MSAPNESSKMEESLHVSDDDYLSVVSGKSREDELTDPLLMKTSQSTINESVDDKSEEQFVHFIEKSTSGALTSENTSSTSSEFDEKRIHTSTSSDSDKQIVIISANTDMMGQSQRLEQMDTNLQGEDQSEFGAFYIPDDIVNETGNQQPSTLLQNIDNENYQIESSDNSEDDNQKKLNIVDQQQQVENSIESSSIESEPTPMPSAEMALGEPYIRNWDVYDLYTNK